MEKLLLVRRLGEVGPGCEARDVKPVREALSTRNTSGWPGLPFRFLQGLDLENVSSGILSFCLSVPGISGTGKRATAATLVPKIHLSILGIRWGSPALGFTWGWDPAARCVRPPGSTLLLAPFPGWEGGWRPGELLQWGRGYLWPGFQGRVGIGTMGEGSASRKRLN